MRNSFRKQRLHNNLSATFKTTAFGAPAIATLDEALALIEHKNRSDAATAYRDRAVPKTPPTREQLLSVANAQAHDPKRQAKVKMPTFSIQRKEIGDA